MRSQPFWPTPSHFPTKTSLSHSFFDKCNPLPSIFQSKQLNLPTLTHFLRKKSHSHSFFDNNDPLSPIFKRKTYSHSFLTKSTHSYPFFNKNDHLPPIFEQKRPIPQFFNKTTHSHPKPLLNCSLSHSHPLPATFTHSQAFWSFYTAIFYENNLLWRAFLLIQLISGP